jgi:hypothetical protein
VGLLDRTGRDRRFANRELLARKAKRLRPPQSFYDMNCLFQSLLPLWDGTHLSKKLLRSPRLRFVEAPGSLSCEPARKTRQLRRSAGSRRLRPRGQAGLSHETLIHGVKLELGLVLASELDVHVQHRGFLW